MVTFGARQYPPGYKNGTEFPIAVAATCSTCDEPVVFKALPTRQPSSYADLHSKVGTLSQNFAGIEQHGFRVARFWPEAAGPAIPASVPADVERAMLQAERNFPTVGNEEAAAVMYRRALELTLKDKAPALAGTLAARIKKMVASHDLTPAIGEWADEIRSLGNDAAHDEGDVDRAELTMIRGFTDAVLRYLYTLPAEVAARRKLPDPSADEDV